MDPVVRVPRSETPGSSDRTADSAVARQRVGPRPLWPASHSRRRPEALGVQIAGDETLGKGFVDLFDRPGVSER